MLLTRSPLFFFGEPKFDEKEAFDLHVLGTPPAFVLSQDQTLIKKFETIFRLLSSKILLAKLLACNVHFYLNRSVLHFWFVLLALFSFQRSTLSR